MRRWPIGFLAHALAAQAIATARLVPFERGIKRCGLPVSPVETSSGARRGEVSQLLAAWLGGSDARRRD
jgi:hypothetical protein